MNKRMCSKDCPCRKMPTPSDQFVPPVLNLDPPAPTVPRVASSIDELKAGQVVVQRVNDQWDQIPITLTASDIEGQVWIKTHFDGSLVILSDPPPEPLVLSSKAQELLDRLADVIEECETYPANFARWQVWREVSRALVDEVNRSQP